MQDVTFKAFVLKQKGVIEDFVHSVRHDDGFPDVQSWTELEYYLRRRQPDIEQRLVDDAKYLWGRYEKEVLNA